MPILRETIETSLPVDDAFEFVADFANAMHWDPGVATSQRIGSGPVAVGARYKLGVRMRGRVVPMEYRITRYEPPRRVVLEGQGSNVEAIDDIRLEPTSTGGTRVHYTADIRLTGLLRLAAPFAGGAFERIARDAADGMRRTLDARATGRQVGAAR